MLFFYSVPEKRGKIGIYSVLAEFIEHLKPTRARVSVRIEDSSEVTRRGVKSARGFVMTQDPAELRQATHKHQKFQRSQSIFEPSLLI